MRVCSVSDMLMSYVMSRYPDCENLFFSKEDFFCGSLFLPRYVIIVRVYFSLKMCFVRLVSIYFLLLRMPLMFLKYNFYLCIISIEDHFKVMLKLFLPFFQDEFLS